MIARLWHWLLETIFKALQKKLYPDYWQEVQRLTGQVKELQGRIAQHEAEAQKVDTKVEAREKEIDTSQAEVNEVKTQLDENQAKREAERKNPPVGVIDQDLGL